MLGTLKQHLPHRRTWLKVLHAVMIPLVIWFTVITPNETRAVGPGMVQLHSVLALIFVSLTLLWSADYLRRGLAGRPGPKLLPWARTAHRIMHHTLVIGLFGVAFTGFLIGLTSSITLWAGGIVPIAPPMGWPKLHQWVGDIHLVEFYLLAALAACHAGFHIWRHLRLQDNALRIMFPKALHKYL